MREDETARLLERQQAFFIFQNKVVGTHVLGEFAAALYFAIHRALRFLINREIALVDFPVKRVAQIVHIARIARIGKFQLRQTFLSCTLVFFFEDSSVLAHALGPVFLVDTVLGHFVDEEKAQALDTLAIQHFLLLKMRENGFANLDATKILF